jgi:hypothetical protein
MTVRGSSYALGDPAGDLPSSADVEDSPPADSTDVIPQGRFWVLAASEGGVDSNRAFKYLCRTPPPDEARDLLQSASGLARCAERRLQHQRR